MAIIKSMFQLPTKIGGINLQMKGARGKIKMKPAICVIISCVVL